MISRPYSPNCLTNTATWKILNSLKSTPTVIPMLHELILSILRPWASNCRPWFCFRRAMKWNEDRSSIARTSSTRSSLATIILSKISIWIRCTLNAKRPQSSWSHSKQPMNTNPKIKMTKKQIKKKPFRINQFNKTVNGLSIISLIGRSWSGLIRKITLLKKIHSKIQNNKAIILRIQNRLGNSYLIDSETHSKSRFNCENHSADRFIRIFFIKSKHSLFRTIMGWSLYWLGLCFS